VKRDCRPVSIIESRGSNNDWSIRFAAAREIDFRFAVVFSENSRAFGTPVGNSASFPTEWDTEELNRTYLPPRKAERVPSPSGVYARANKILPVERVAKGRKNDGRY